MRLIFTTLLLLSTTFALPSALPLPASLPNPKTASINGLPGGVYLCAGPNWTQCQAWMPPGESSRCHELDERSMIHSLGPDPGGYCVLYYGHGCNTKTAFKVVVFPGVAEKLERFTSWKCAAGEAPGDVLRGICR